MILRNWTWAIILIKGTKGEIYKTSSIEQKTVNVSYAWQINQKTQ